MTKNSQSLYYFISMTEQEGYLGFPEDQLFQDPFLGNIKRTNEIMN